VIARPLFLAGLALPRLAPACAVCFSANDESRTAYVATTVLLSLLPLVFLFGFFGWLVRRTRAHEREAEQRRQKVAPFAPRG
jgi:hypothetical protein